jgi:hypothetical protein
METLLDHPRACAISVSFVLLDWSCRESLHILDYLNDQTLARNRYEILWIEYYSRRSADLQRRIAEAKGRAEHPPVDTYIILDMPPSVYYHKHLMYNAGILLARGQIICFCDSDAFMQPTFAASIVRHFETDPNIVLHFDEVRNNDHRYHPFNYPDFEDVVGPGCANWVDGRPRGLTDPVDPLHTRNYGACMCARRDDLIAVGGADMHIDYLGHICGPYELTFRLINAGKREVWHTEEWLYHVWHPGQAGDRNYAGPHDGQHMSATALDARTTRRIEPLVPHPAIVKLRDGAVDGANVLGEIMVSDWLEAWDIRNVETHARSYRLGQGEIQLLERMTPQASGKSTVTDAPPRRLGGLSKLRFAPLVLGLLWRQLQVKYQAAKLRAPASGTAASVHEPFRKVRALLGFLRRMLEYNRHLFKVCWVHLCYVASLGRSEVAIYGDGDAARILCALARLAQVRIRAVCPFDSLAHGQCPGQETWAEKRLLAYDGMVIVAAFVNSAQHVGRLERLGLDRTRLVVLE